jgi:hypothetical protein
VEHETVADGAQGKVEYLDTLIDCCHDPLRQSIGIAHPFGGQYLNAQDIGPWSNTGQVGGIAGNDGGHRCPVTTVFC